MFSLKSPLRTSFINTWGRRNSRWRPGRPGISPDPRTDGKIIAFPAHLEEESLPPVTRAFHSAWNRATGTLSA